MQLDLTKFPRLEGLHLRRSDALGEINSSSFSENTPHVPDTVTKIAASSISQASSAADSRINQSIDKVQSLADELKSQLPAKYAVGLRSYCQENRGDNLYSNCSRVSNSFAFDPLRLFGSFTNEIDALLPREAKSPLEAYDKTSHFAISAYVISMVVNCLAILSGTAWTISKRKIPSFSASLSKWFGLLTLFFSTVGESTRKMSSNTLMIF